MNTCLTFLKKTKKSKPKPKFNPYLYLVWVNFDIQAYNGESLEESNEIFEKYKAEGISGNWYRVTQWKITFDEKLDSFEEECIDSWSDENDDY